MDNFNGNQEVFANARKNFFYNNSTSTFTQVNTDFTPANSASQDVTASTSKGLVTNFNCPKCNLTFLTPEDFKQHYLSHPPTVEPKMCQYCNDAFTTETLLSDHIIATHSNESKYNRFKMKVFVRNKNYSKECDINTAGKKANVIGSTCLLCASVFCLMLKKGEEIGTTICYECRAQYFNPETNPAGPMTIENVKIFSCPGCQHKFVAGGSLEKHLAHCAAAGLNKR